MTSSDLQLSPALAARLSLDEHAGPAPRLPHARATAMVEAALQAWPEPVASLPAARAPRSPRSSVQTLAMAAAVLLALVGAAAAARLSFVSSAVPAPQPPVRAVVGSAPPVAAPALAPMANAEPVTATDSDNTALQHGAAHPAPSPHAAPEDLLQKANHLRAEGHFAEARDTYAQVYERHPHALSAYVAEIAAASIELEHLGRPALAKSLFERAIRAEPDGALDIEARQGLALSLRDLGDSRAETTVLRALLDAHPRSPAAARARLRLRELGAAGHAP